jgi:feruloyl-CoA synthase
VLQDAVITGENRAYAGLLAWLNVGGCRGLLGTGAPEDPGSLATHVTVREYVRAAIARWNASHSGMSQHIQRVLVLPEPPSVDANEITDRGLHQPASRPRAPTTRSRGSTLPIPTTPSS